MTLSDGLSISRQDSDHFWQVNLAEGGCFVLAEAALNDRVPWLAERWSGSLEQSCLYWGEAGRIHASISPYCFPVGTENWPQIQEHLVREEGWGIGIQLEWFMRALSPQDQLLALMEHLRQWSLVVTPEGQDAILRVGDWQTLTTLLSASTLSEATDLFGPVSSFFQIDPEGTLQIATLHRREKAKRSAVLPRELTARQWQALLVPAEQKVLARYAEHLRLYHVRWRETEEHELLAFVREHSNRAKRYGFTHDQDIVRYLALATELEPGFINAPWAKPILQEPEYIGEQSRMDRLFSMAIERMVGK